MTKTAFIKCTARLHEASPVLSLVLVLLMPMWLRHDPGSSTFFGPDQTAVAQAVDSLPYRIGHWAGSDIPVPEAAITLLRPNAMFSRRYTNLASGTDLDLVIVHCGDARDMLGHYPPVCYPNAGWIYSGQSQGRHDRRTRGKRIELPMHNQIVPARMYEFTRMENWSRDIQIRVINFFVLPDGTLTRDIDDASQLTNWLGASVHGIAQIQFVIDRDIALIDAIQSATELLEGITPLMDALGVARDERE